MNIFYINKNPIIAAQELADDHIRKMAIESAQMLCFAHYSVGNQPPYKNSKQHFNHPSSKWVRESIDHYNWLLEHGLEICFEFEERYGKEHATQKVLIWLLNNKPDLPKNGFTPPPQCIPIELQLPDTIDAYKNFYIKDKIAIKKLSWKKLNNTPAWAL
jgi:hypothetical protein